MAKTIVAIKSAVRQIAELKDDLAVERAKNASIFNYGYDADRGRDTLNHMYLREVETTAELRKECQDRALETQRLVGMVRENVRAYTAAQQNLDFWRQEAEYYKVEYNLAVRPWYLKLRDYFKGL